MSVPKSTFEVLVAALAEFDRSTGLNGDMTDEDHNAFSELFEELCRRHGWDLAEYDAEMIRRMQHSQKHEAEELLNQEPS